MSITSQLISRCQQFTVNQVACGVGVGAVTAVALASLLIQRIGVTPILGLMGLSVTPINVAGLAMAFTGLSVAGAGAVAFALINLAEYCKQLSSVEQPQPVVKPSEPKELLQAGLLYKNEEWVREAVEQSPALVMSPDFYFSGQEGTTGPLWTAAMVAAYQGLSLDLIRFLFEQGATNYCKDIYTDSVLRMATQTGDLGVVKFLVEEQNCDPTDLVSSDVLSPEEARRLDAQNDDGGIEVASVGEFKGLSYTGGMGTPLHLAIQHGHFDVARYLVEKGASLDLVNMRASATPLVWAFLSKKEGAEEFVRFLIGFIEAQQTSLPVFSLDEIKAEANQHNRRFNWENARLNEIPADERKFALCKFLCVDYGRNIKLAQLIQKIAASEITGW